MKLWASIIFIVFFAASAVADPINRDQIFVKDGDTIIFADGKTKHAKDQEYRLVDFDTPEITRAKCPSEVERGLRAAARLVALLDSGPIDLTDVPCSCIAYLVL